MTKQRRAELEARIIASRRREPQLFTAGAPRRPRWAHETERALLRPVHRAPQASDDVWCNSRKRAP